MKLFAASCGISLRAFYSKPIRCKQRGIEPLEIKIPPRSALFCSSGIGKLWSFCMAKEKGTEPLSFKTLRIIYGGRPNLDSKGTADKSLSLCLVLL
jgi:hypothetical protein